MYKLEDVYNDFFGVEKEIKEKISTETVEKEKSSPDDFMKEKFDKINELNIEDSSKDTLKKIIEYMRKYNEKIESNYIPFNISIIVDDKDLSNEIANILKDSAIFFSYVEKYKYSEISLYNLEKDLSTIFEENSIVLIKDLKMIDLKDEEYRKKFFNSLEINLNKKNLIMISGIKDEIDRFFQYTNISNDYFTFQIIGIMPDVGDVYNELLQTLDLDDDKKVELLDYISGTFPKTKLDYSNYKDKLRNYISFNKEIPKLSEEKTTDEIFAELNELVGLKKIKQSIYDLVDLISLKNKTKEDLKINDVNLHMVFLGNPGTGKTTVARLLVNILYNLKYIRENKLVEVTSKDLVAEYVGQTAPKTNEVVERALGGVLFIDEAYALASTSNTGNTYNAEAIATLIQAMENHRDDLVVIFAGYTKEMQAFLDSNSGIVSRIGYTLEFEDYTEDELVDIFKGMVKKAGFTVEDAAIEKLRTIINEYKDTKNFGNARFVRNVYEKTIVKHASNTKNIKSKKKLKTITEEDISTENLIKQ